MEDDFIKKLRERYEKGEISRETYEDILRRYLDEVEEEKAEEEPEKIREEGEYENSTMGGIDDILSRAMEKMDEELKKFFPGDEKTTAEEVEEKVFKKVESKEIENKAEDKQGRDYKCAGACTIPSGRYNYISASGSVKIKGDIRAKKLSVAGSLYAEGTIRANIISFGGSAKINGDVVGESISCGGVLHANRVKGEKIRVGGAIVCNEIIGERVSVEGSIKGTYLKAEGLKMKIDGKSSLDRIVAERVEIRSKRGILRKFTGTMKVSKIFGEEIYVECVRAEFIKGEKVTVGDNCYIDRIEAEKLKVSRKSKVKEVVRR